MNSPRWQALRHSLNDKREVLQAELAYVRQRWPEAFRELLQAWPKWRRRTRLWWLASLRRPFRDTFARDTEELGILGEILAARWLQRRGFTVLYRNFQNPTGGEVDLVCQQGEALVFVEVKTRRRELLHRPADAVDATKQRLIIRAAREWLRLLRDPAVSYRYDIVEVLLYDGQPPEVRLIENAFQEAPVASR